MLDKIGCCLDNINEQVPVLLVGDFNARTASLEDGMGLEDYPCRHNVDAEKNSWGMALIDFLKVNKLGIVNGRITCGLNNYTCISSRGCSVVDYFIGNHIAIKCINKFSVTTMVDLIKKFNLYVTHPSDHSILSVDIDISQLCSINQRHTSNFDSLSNNEPKFNWEKIPNDFMNSDDIKEKIHKCMEKITNLMYCEEISQKVLDEVYATFIEILTEEINLKIPKIKCGIKNNCNFRRSPSRKWWSKELYNMKKEMMKNEKEWLRCHHKDLKKELRKSYISARNKYKKAIRKQKSVFVYKKNIESEKLLNSDPRLFWKRINKSKKHKVVINRLKYRQKVVTSKNEVIKCLVSHFKDTLNSYDSGSQEMGLLKNNILPEHQEIAPDILDRKISLLEVQQAVYSLKSYKSFGHDRVPGEALKNNLTIQFLAAFFDLCLEKSLSPLEWRKSIIIPIPKSNNCIETNNLRGISLVSVVYKVYCSILNHRLTEWLQLTNSLNEVQSGFRPGRSCMDNIFTLTNVIHSKLLDGKECFVAFIDLRKAFDSVDRRLLWQKLLGIGISGKMTSILRNLYEETSCCIKIDNDKSDFFPVNQGVRQGCILSPLLFNLFIDDLCNDLQSDLGIQLGEFLFNCLLYADDLALMADNEKALQILLQRVGDWCNKNLLNINNQKSAIVHFRNKKAPICNFQFSMNGKPIRIQNEYKYLGVVIDEHLDFEKMGNVNLEKAKRAFNTIKQEWYRNGEMSPVIFKKVISTCIFPIFDYGCPQWSMFVMRLTKEALNLKIARFF